jgi:hypothetical protein
MMLYSLNDAVKLGSTYSAAAFGLIFRMSFRPFLRHRIRHGHGPG